MLSLLGAKAGCEQRNGVVWLVLVVFSHCCGGGGKGPGGKGRSRWQAGKGFAIIKVSGGWGCSWWQWGPWWAETPVDSTYLEGGTHRTSCGYNPPGRHSLVHMWLRCIPTKLTSTPVSALNPPGTCHIASVESAWAASRGELITTTSGDVPTATRQRSSPSFSTLTLWDLIASHFTWRPWDDTAGAGPSLLLCSTNCVASCLPKKGGTCS